MNIVTVLPLCCSSLCYVGLTPPTDHGENPTQRGWITLDQRLPFYTAGFE